MSHSILVVDDDEKCQRLACDVLAHHGYRLHRAGSGEEALEFASASHVDLVLLDIQLPGLDGIETFKALRAMDGWRQVPVIAMTASVMPAESSTLLTQGFDGFLAKPMAIKELLTLVRRTLSKAPE